MAKRPAGINRNRMSKEVGELWDLGDFTRLTVRELATYVGVSPSVLYYWFAGMKPRKAHERLIVEAISKIVADHPMSEMEKVYPVWGESPLRHLITDPARRAEEKFSVQMREIFADLQQKITPLEKGLLIQEEPAWAGLMEMLGLLKRHGYEVKIRRAK